MNHALSGKPGAVQPVASPKAVELPATPLEEEIAALWARLMGLSVVGRHDDFFELGGHSLMAVKVVAHLRRSRGVELPIAALLIHPTVARLAANVEEVAQTSTMDWDSRAHLGAGPVDGMKQPLFIVGGVGGNVNNLRWLGKALDTRRPVIGLQTRGVAGHSMHDSIAAMARDHVRDIRLEQPEGPYCIAGYSGGAFTAHEIARQLEEAGDRVAFLGVLDMYAPGCSPPRGERGQRQSVDLKRLWLRVWPRLREALTPEAVLWLMTPFAPEWVRLTKLSRRWRAISRTHRPGIFGGALWLYVSAEDTPDPAQASALVEGWAKLAPSGVHLRMVSGNHLSMLKAPHVAGLAEALEADLREVLR